MNLHRLVERITVVFLLPMLFTAGSALAEGPVEEHRKLVQVRDSLLKKLEAKKSDRGSVREMRLRLERAADRDDMDLTVRGAGSKWVEAFANVPGWEQSTMQEWRGFYLANRTGGAWRNLLKHEVGPMEVNADDGKLSGKLDVNFLLDRTEDQQLPPDFGAGWWDRFIPVGHLLRKQQQYEVAAEVNEDVAILEIVLEGGVHWDPRKTGKKKYKGPIVRRPVLARIQVPSTRFSLTDVRTPTWNGGFHEGDATGLKYNPETGKLTGTLVIMLHQDGWMPWSGGKNYQKAPHVITFEMDATLEHHALSGTYRATGDMGKYTGVVRGIGGKAVLGRYSGKGQLGVNAGPVTGMLLDDFRAPEKLLGDAPKPADGKAAGERINRLLHEIRALQLALQNYPMSLGECLEQTATAQPVWTEDNASALADYAARAATLTAELDGSGQLPEAISERQFAGGPSFVAQAMKVPTDGSVFKSQGNPDSAGALPALPQFDGWYYLPEWKVIGPFEQRKGLEHDDGQAVDIVPVDNISYRQQTDRLGAERADAPERTWQTIQSSGTRISPSWEKSGFFQRFRGESWYATASLTSRQERAVWISIESADHAKLWINGKLVWTGTEKPYRYRRRGREFVKVTLRKGVNNLLIRAHRDRRASWVRLAVSNAKQQKGRPESPVTLSDRVYPKATPPLVWDIDKGINVAWRNEQLAGRTRPAVAGEKLLVTAGADSLACVDMKTGKTLWSKQVTGSATAHRPRGASTPVTDGEYVYILSGNGKLAKFDLSGKQIWAKDVQLVGGVLHLHEGLLAAEGPTAEGWSLPEQLKKHEEDKKRQRMHGAVVFDADDGELKSRHTWPGEFNSGASRLVVLGKADGPVAFLHTSGGHLLDVKEGADYGKLHCERPGSGVSSGASGGYTVGRGYRFSGSGGRLFMTTQEQAIALDLWEQKGRPAWSHRWESNYGHGGFGSIVAPSVATEKYLFKWQPVLERGPHCPDPRMELHVQDAATGRPLNRLKPAMGKSVRHGIDPVVAGGYLFCLDAGGGSHGGHSTHGQVLVVTADDKLQVVARNLVDMDTQTSPVFSGERMFLRSGKGLVCIAVTDEKGSRFQEEKLARTLLGEIGTAPTSADPVVVKPLTDLKPDARRPVGPLRDDRSTENWIGAGPFDGSEKLSEKLLDTTPVSGSRLADGITFRTLTREEAYRLPPRYRREYTLQGTGDIVPTFTTLVDPRCVSGPEGSGLLYTVLDNTRDRIVVPTLKANGVTQWLGGHQLKTDDPIRLQPGLYPLMVRVDPEYYKVDTRQIVPPVAVLKALQAGALQKIDWPGTWKVVGPIPADSASLSGKDLATIPESLTMGEKEFPVYEGQTRDRTLYLTALLGLRPGQKPDFANAPEEKKIGVPNTAYCFTEITLPEDGTLYITAGADWFMRWYVDGEMVYDRLDSGNGAPPTDVTAHPFAVKLSKGTHVVAVQVKPGSKGWSVTSAAGFAAKMTDKLAEFKVPSKIKVKEPDFRFSPAFKVIPHPPTIRANWEQQVRDSKARLQRIIDNLPGTPEAKAAKSILEAASQGSAASQ